MHLFSRKTLVLSVLALLTLFVLNSGASPTYAATHSTSITLKAITNGPKVAMQTASTVEGCPSGYACIYPENAGWNGGHPSLMFYYYGTYPLQNQYGNHYIYNNQTGGAPFWLCTDSNGDTCPWYVGAGTSAQADFTPINSVKLTSSL